MAANTITNPVDIRILNPSRIGLVNEVAEGLGALVNHTARGGLIHSKFTFDENTTIISAGVGAAKAGGIRLMDFPAGKIAVQAARISGRLTLSGALMSTTAGEIGLGTAEASGAVAVLGGTATFEDILEGGSPALGNIGAAATIEMATWDDVRTLVPASGTSPSLYLNAATTFAAGTAENMEIVAGTEVEVWWIHMEP